MRSIRILPIALFALSLAAAGACSDTGDANAAAAEACIASCDKQGSATGCTDIDTYVQTCKQLCAPLVASLTADCAAKAEAHYTCLQTLSWACATGGNAPQPAGDACDAEIQAFSTCFQQTP